MEHAQLEAQGLRRGGQGWGRGSRGEEEVRGRAAGEGKGRGGAGVEGTGW